MIHKILDFFAYTLAVYAIIHKIQCRKAWADTWKHVNLVLECLVVGSFEFPQA